MVSNDIPNLAKERDARFRWVAIGVTCALSGVVFGLWRCNDRIERERAFERSVVEQRRLDRAERDREAEIPVAPLAPTTRSTSNASPVEFELVRGGTRMDLDQPSIPLGDGRRIQITPKPLWTYSGAGLFLEYPRSVHVNTEGDTVRLADHAATAELTLIATDVTVEDGLAEAIRSYEESGQVEDTTAMTLTLFGQRAQGERLRIAGLAVEVAAAQAGKGRVLLLVIAANSSGADLTPIREIVETVKLGRRPPMPHFNVTLIGETGDVLGVAEAIIGTPFGISGDRMTIARRATVREHRHGIRFEHSPDLIVATSTSADAMPSVILRSGGGEVVISVMEAPVAIPPGDLTTKFAADLQRAHAVKRSFGGTEYDGVAGETSAGEITANTQVFALEREGRHFVVSVQATTDEMPRAERLVEPVIATVR